MKRGLMEDEGRRRDRSPDVKRQRHTQDGHYQQSSNSYRPQQRSNDSYSRREDRYQPPRRPDSTSSRDQSTRRDERDTPTPHDRRAPAHERDTVSNVNSSSSYEKPMDAATDNSASATTTGSSSTAEVRLLSEAKETDPHRLAQRQKQIDYGKNTVGYDRYCAAVSRHQRRRPIHPTTPDRTLNVSKKAFDGMIRKWRQALHKYDPPELQNVSEELQAANGNAASSAVQPASTEAARSSTFHDSDMADLDPEHYAVGINTATSAPTLSIFENFVEGDMDDDDDLL